MSPEKPEASKPAPVRPQDVGILIIDDDEQGRTALAHVLDSEGWRVRVVPLMEQALPELAGGEWTLVIANVAMTGLSGPTFTTLKELALAPAVPLDEAGQVIGRQRVRVLFLVPDLVAEHAQPLLERDRLPYTLKPFHLHDFLEKVSDLLLEALAIQQAIRRVRYEYRGEERRRRERRTGGERRDTMFAARDDYQMTEEEIAEFERYEEEERKAAEKEKKKTP